MTGSPTVSPRWTWTCPPGRGECVQVEGGQGHVSRGTARENLRPGRNAQNGPCARDRGLRPLRGATVAQDVPAPRVDPYVDRIWGTRIRSGRGRKGKSERDKTGKGDKYY